MKFCESCGSPLEGEVKFCPSCGSAVTGRLEPKATNPEPDISAAPEQGSYGQAAPTQNSYSPEPQAYAPEPQTYAPAQSSYSPGAQSYTPPSQGQGSYSPPQGGYSPPPGGYPGAVAVKEKKPIDKRIFIFGGAGLALVLVIVLLVSLLGGKDKTPAVSDDPNLGLWVAVAAEMWGIQTDLEDVFEEGFTIELKDKGKGVLSVDGETAKGNWTLKNGIFEFKGGGAKYAGTLTDGVLTLLDLNGTGMNLVFYKDGARPIGGGAQSGFVSPTTRLDVETYWYGSIIFTNVSYGGVPSADEWRDIWGYISEDSYLSYMELFETPDYSDAPILSMYMDVFNTRLDAEIGEENAWIYDLYLTLEDEPYFRPYLENGSLRMDYPYDDGYMVCDITIFIREEGAPWDEDWDPLPPGYYEYKAGLEGDWSGGNGGADPGDSAPMGEYDTWGADYYGPGEADFDVLLEVWNWVREAPSDQKPTYDEVCQRIGVKGGFNEYEAEYSPENLHVRWYSKEQVGAMDLAFKIMDDGELRYYMGGVTGSFVNA